MPKHKSKTSSTKFTSNVSEGPIDIAALRRNAAHADISSTSSSDNENDNDDHDRRPTAQTTAYASAEELALLLDDGYAFTTEDQDKLAENEHGRFMPNSKKIGHALIHRDKNGNYVAKQFSAPGGKATETPTVRPLLDIELITRFDAERALATTPNGTKMVAMRSIKVNFADSDAAPADPETESDLWFFSPTASHLWKGNIFWGSGKKNPKIFKDRSEVAKNLRQELDDVLEEVEELGEIYKQGSVEVESASVVIRDSQRTRNPDQNTVMQGSAIDAYKQFYETHHELLTEPVCHTFEQAENARQHWQGGSAKTQPRPEWLHLIGYGMTPVTQNPQTASNLVAAPKYLNSEMMTTERVAKWHALKRPQAKVSASGEFKVLLDSDIMEFGNYRVKIVETGNRVVLSQQLCPFVKYPQYPKPSDIMQSTLVTHSLLTKQTPVLVNNAKFNSRTTTTATPIAVTKVTRVKPEVIDHDDSDSSSDSDSSCSISSSTRIANARRDATAARKRYSKHQAASATATHGHEPKARAPRLSTYRDWMSTVDQIAQKYGNTGEDSSSSDSSERSHEKKYRRHR